ncbi:MAG: hypothetical protein ACK5XN_07540, partial [Bacteroidota bacterium]
AAYEEFKQIAKQIFDSYRAAVSNLRQAAEIIVRDLRAEYGLSEDEMRAIHPYLVKFLGELRNEKPAPKDKPAPKPKPKQGVLEAKNINDLLDAKVAAYLEIGDFEGEHGIYLVYNDGGRGTVRVLLEVSGKDFSVALRKAQQIARQVHQGVDSPATSGVYKTRLAGKVIGVSTTARSVSKFNENSEIGNQALQWGDRYPDVKLKDLFDVDPEYAFYAAKNATEGMRAVTVREYLRSRPEYLKAMSEQRSTQQAFARQAARITKERALIQAFRDMRLTAHVATDHLILKGVRDDQAQELADIGATWNSELKRFEVDAEYVKAFLDALAQRARGNQGGVRQQDVTEGTGITNPRVREVRRRHDELPDQSALGVPIGDLVGQDTQELLMRGLQFGIPRQILDEQTEDVARAV